MQIIGSQDERTAAGVIEVVVPDLRLALSFYTQLGFVIERETPTFVTLRWGEMFFFVAENPQAPTAQRWTNVRIIVPDVDAVWDHVSRLGLAVGNPIADRPYGLRDFTVKDPAGFEIRFAQVLV
jgi:catechol 2,3-dioxygenase-like lactoylglutathione lyase family enzyme